MEYQSHTLENGIRIIHKYDSSSVAYCGLFINTGSRDELENEQGLAHFIEHVIFKGTSKRRAFQINSCLDDVGGDINAYTTKEETCIYAVFLNNYYKKAIDVIQDIVFNSIFPEKELVKEKTVIIDEINSYKDNPAELIFDDFEELLFKNHTIGRNILGTPKQLKRFSKTDVQNFIKRNYCTDEIVFASVGKIDFSKLVKIAEQYFGIISTNKKNVNRITPENYLPETKTVTKKTYQTHCLIGNIAYDLKDKRRPSLALLNNILGGPSLNSRLNLALRERNGIAYNIDSGYTSYTDTGVWCIYFGCDKEKFDKCISLIDKEIELIKTKKLSSLQLQKAKKQFIGQVAISSENKESLLMALGKSFLHFNRVDSLEDVNKKIQAITSEQLIEIANEIFDKNQLSMLIYK